MNAAITVQTVPFRRRFNPKKANWEQYAYQLDAAVENIPSTAECYDQFVNVLRKVARKSIPRGCRRNYVPGLTSESIQLIEKYREIYEDDPFADSTITFGDELMSAISEERRKAWQTLIESTDMTHNSKKAWSTIRKLCDDPCKSKQHCNTTANQVAHQLLLNGREPNIQPKVRLDRQRYSDDPGFTIASTAAEHDIGIRVLKNGKAPGLDDIQTELIKQFGPKARDWLLRFFNNCTESKTIPKLWRHAKVVALLKPGKDPSVAKSFRPISLRCYTYKLFERLILNRIAEHVDAKLIPEQAGFRPGKSCTSQLLNLTEHIEDGYEKRLITWSGLRGLVCCLRHGQSPTSPQQGARDDWRHTPDRPDTHHAGKQTLLRGAEREEDPLATTTKRTTTGKCTGTDVDQHLHQRPARTRRHSQLHLRRRLVHRVPRKRLQQHRSVTHVCPEHY